MDLLAKQETKGIVSFLFFSFFLGFAFHFGEIC